MKDKTLNFISQICEKKQAFDIKIINVEEKTSICSYLFIASVHSNAQMRAILDELRLKFKNKKFLSDGNFNSQWVVIDLGDIFIHLFTPEERLRYQFDELWENRPKDKNIIIKTKERDTSLKN